MGITAERLRVRDNRVSIRELSAGNAPRHIILLIDVGEDMALRWPGALYDRWQFSRFAADALLSYMRPPDTVSLYAFAEKQRPLILNSGDFRHVSQLSNQLPTPGTKDLKRELGTRSKFAAAIMQVLASKDEKLHFGDVIVLFTCGEVGEEDSPYALAHQGTVIDQEKSDLNKLQAPLVAAGIRTFWFTATALNPRFGPTGTGGITLLEHRNLYDILTSMGGLIFDPWEGDLQGDEDLLLPDDLPWEWAQPKLKIPRQKMTDQDRTTRTAQEIYDAIRNVYTVKLQFSAESKRPHKLELDLLDAQGHPDKSGWLFYPRKLPFK